MQHPGVSASWGVEIDPVKCSKGRAYISLVVRDMAAAGLLVTGAISPSMICVPVEQVRLLGIHNGSWENASRCGCGVAGALVVGVVSLGLPHRAPAPQSPQQLSTLEPATHAYACWEGMPKTAKCALGSLFVASSTLQTVAVVQRAFRRGPLLEMREMGFGELQLLKTFPVHLSGSQRQLNAYIFIKQAAAGQQQQQQGSAGAGKQQRGKAPVAPAGAARKQAGGRPAAGSKRGAAAAAVAAADDDAASDASCDTSLPLAQWLRVNGIRADASSSEATSGRVRRKRRLS